MTNQVIPIAFCVSGVEITLILKTHTHMTHSGKIKQAKEKVANRFLYAGEQYDRITGEYHLRARNYNPELGRFTQEDTYRGDGLNLYAYVANNPINYIDPSGHVAKEVESGDDKKELSQYLLDNNIYKNPYINYTNSSGGGLVSKKSIEKYINENPQLTDIQKAVLRKKINEYATNDILKEHYIDNDSDDPLIMFFEGAGAGEPVRLKGYPNGLKIEENRYNAMAVVIKNREIVSTYMAASTMPDRPEEITMATVMDGVYEVNSHLYKTEYPSLKITNIGPKDTVDATYGKDKGIDVTYNHNDYLASDVLIHFSFGSDNYTYPSSTACLQIHYNQYSSFLRDVGVITPNSVDVINHQPYSGTYVENVNGFLVIDRTLEPW